MIGLATDFIGAARRCIGDNLRPAPLEIDMLAAKIWRDCVPASLGDQAGAWPPRSLSHNFYRRAAELALQGRSSAVTI